MKKALTTFAAIFVLSWQVHAQLNQGRMVITGETAVSFSKTTPKTWEQPQVTLFHGEGKTKNLSLSPGFGFFVTEGLEVGIAAGYTKQTEYSLYITQYTNDFYFSETETRRESQTIRYALSPYVTKYFMLNDRFGFLAIASAKYATEDRSYSYSAISSSANSNSEVTSSYKEESENISVILSPGIIFFVSKHIGLRAQAGRIGYERAIYKSNYNSTDIREQKTKSSPLILEPGRFSFGLSYYFGGS